eukprot:2687276-Amphidinium_carterae.1
MCWGRFRVSEPQPSTFGVGSGELCHYSPISDFCRSVVSGVCKGFCDLGIYGMRYKCCLPGSCEVLGLCLTPIRTPRPWRLNG